MSLILNKTYSFVRKRDFKILSSNRYYMHIAHISKSQREYICNENKSRTPVLHPPASCPQRQTLLPFSCLAFHTIVHRSPKFHKHICRYSSGRQIHMLIWQSDLCFHQRLAFWNMMIYLRILNHNKNSYSTSRRVFTLKSMKQILQEDKQLPV